MHVMCGKKKKKRERVYVVLMNLFVAKIFVASLKLLSEMESASVSSNEHASTTQSNANSSSVRAKCERWKK